MAVDLLFICGGLEPGANGVGDHVDRLARELTGRGRRVALLAFADRLVDEPRHERRAAAAGGTVRCLRLPAALAGAERLAAAQDFVAACDPAWISLHYVNFAFHPRGLPWRENGRLVALLRGRRSHLMVHELWVGLDDDAGPRTRLLGLLQRQVMKRLLARLPIAAVDTSAPVFQRQLARLGVRAGRLPIFANLCLQSGTGAATTDWLDAELARLGIPADALRFLSFGSLPLNFPAERVLRRIAGWAEAAGRSAAVLFVGRGGPGARLIPGWREAFPGLRFVELGPQPAEAILDALDAVDYGLCPFPLWAAAKSSSTAVMLERGLPVVIGAAGRRDAEDALPDDVADLVVRADLAESRLPRPGREAPVRRRIDRLAQVVPRYEALIAAADAGTGGARPGPAALRAPG